MRGDSIVLAQLGCGYWGPNLLRAFTSQSGCHVKWVVDLSAERRRYVEMHHPQVRTTADTAQVLTDPEVDGLVVATPAATHAQLAMAALQAGKHVLVEKPLALTADEAERLGETATIRQRTLMVGHTFLFNPAVRCLKHMLEAGDLGEPYYIYCQRLNLGQVRSDVNAWWNLAPHDLSVVAYLCQSRMPEGISAHGVARIQSGIEDVVFATVTWPEGLLAHIHVSWLDPGKVRRITIVGSQKMVTYDDVNEARIALIDKGFDRVPRLGERMDYDNANSYALQARTGDVWLPRVDRTEPLQLEAAHFLDCIRTGQIPLTGPKHAQDVVAMLEAGQRSLSAGGAVVPIERGSN